MKKITFANYRIRVEENFRNRHIIFDDFKDIPETSQSTLQIDETIYDVCIQKIDNDFIWIYATYGNPNPCPKNLYDNKKQKYLDNKRSKDQVEMNNQLFALYSFKNRILCFNDSRKRKFIQDLFNKILKIEISIANIYVDIDTFTKKIKKLKSIKFTSTDNILTQNVPLNNAFRDYLGINENIDFSLEINAKKGGFGIDLIDNIISKIKIAKDQMQVKNLTLIGLDDKNLEEVFNDGTFIKKFEQYFEKNEEGLFSPQEVKNHLINRFSNV